MISDALNWLINETSLRFKIELGCLVLLWIIIIFHLIYRTIYRRGYDRGYHNQVPPVNALAMAGFRGNLQLGKFSVRIGEEEE